MFSHVPYLVSVHVCKLPAVIQVCLFYAPQEDTGPWFLCLPVETPQPQLQHEQLGEQLPAGNAGEAGISQPGWVSQGLSSPLKAQGDILRHLCSGQSNEPSVTPVFSRV